MGNEVRCRLCAMGNYQQEEDKDDIYASTPLLLTLKILILLALLRGYAMVFADVSTAFLYAVMTTEMYVIPPKEFYPYGGVLWLLRKAMYGLRGSPKAWQDHFAEVVELLGGKRMKSEPNVYYFKDLCLFV